MTEAPVFLVGPARSGTSLLYKMLCLHPDAAYISNWVRLLPAVPAVAVMNRLAAALPDVRQRVWFADGNAYVYDKHRSLARRLFPMPVEGEPVFTRSGLAEVPGGVAPGRTPDLERLRRTLRSVRRASGGSLLVNKRIANILRIPLLVDAFPEARFLSLVRDGRAVAASLRTVDWWEDSTVWWYGGSPDRWAAEGRDPWELCARNWVEEVRITRSGLAHVAPERQAELRYEDFVTDPMPALRSAAAFAGLDPDDRRWQRALQQQSFPDRNERWRTQLDDATVAAITEWQRDELERLGYEAPVAGRGTVTGGDGSIGQEEERA
jgi:omega-hydroxy-beta-dihydromenaquinone-9 sulfotransferase